MICSILLSNRLQSARSNKKIKTICYYAWYIYTTRFFAKAMHLYEHQLQITQSCPPPHKTNGICTSNTSWVTKWACLRNIFLLKEISLPFNSHLCHWISRYVVYHWNLVYVLVNYDAGVLYRKVFSQCAYLQSPYFYHATLIWRSRFPLADAIKSRRIHHFQEMMTSHYFTCSRHDSEPGFLHVSPHPANDRLPASFSTVFHRLAVTPVFAFNDVTFDLASEPLVTFSFTQNAKLTWTDSALQQRSKGTIVSSPHWTKS